MKNPIESLNKHHRFVYLMRVLLPVLASGMVLALLVWPQIAKRADFITGALKNSVRPTNLQAKIDMKKVQFFSEDEKGQPFTVSSEKIVEIDPENKVVQMDNPKGEMSLNSGIKLTSNSPLAWFYQDTQVVYFKQDVVVFSDNGYQADLSDVVVDYKKQLSYSNNPLKVRGEKMDLDSKGFYMRQNGEELDFKGPAKVVLKEENQKKMTITAQRAFEVRQKTQTITAFADVLANDGVNKVYSDQMTAYFRQKGKNKYELKSVQAQKNVRIVTPDETITGNDAYYDVTKEKAFITGNVVVKRAAGTMQGDRAVIDMKTGQSQLEVDYSKSSTPARVKGTILPDKLKKKE